MRIEIEKEDDGRWIADVCDIPGVMVYGITRQDAWAKAKALALRIIADRIDIGNLFRNWMSCLDLSQTE